MNIQMTRKNKSIFLNNQSFIFYEYKIKTNKKLNIIDAGDNFAASILNDLISKKFFSKYSLEKAHKFATAYCLANKNI